METRKIRELTFLLPGDDPEEFDPVRDIPRDETAVVGQIIQADLWTRAKLTGVTITRCWFVNADLSSIELARVTLDRCVLRGCTLVGAHVSETTFKNVILENCRLDYATLTTIRATGPLAFLGCALTETTFDRCKLNSVAFNDCKFNAPTFVNCDMRGADLRGNDLSRTIGVTTSLRGATISESQFPAFTEAVARELELTVKSIP